MSSRKTQLCERCKKRPARYFICNCKGHTDASESKQLCEVCFKDEASPEELASHKNFQDIIRKGKCKYCGEPAACGSFSGWSGGFDENRTDLRCKECDKDLAKFAKMPENQFPVFTSLDEVETEQAMKQMAERDRRQKEFMKQKVSQRRLKNN